VAQKAIQAAHAAAAKYVQLTSQWRELESKAAYLEAVDRDDDTANKKLSAASANRLEAQRVRGLAASALVDAWERILTAEEEMEWVRESDSDCVPGARVFLSRQALCDTRLRPFAGRIGVLEGRCRHPPLCGVWDVRFAGMEGEPGPMSMGIEILVGVAGQHWLVYAASRFQRAAARSQAVLIAEKDAMMAWSHAKGGAKSASGGMHEELVALRQRVKAARLVADAEVAVAHRPVRARIAWTTTLCGGSAPPELQWPDQTIVDSDSCCAVGRAVVLSPGYFQRHPEQEVFNGIVGRLARRVRDGEWAVRFPKGLAAVEEDLLARCGAGDSDLLYVESVFSMMAEAHPPPQRGDVGMSLAATRAMAAWFPANAADLVLEGDSHCDRGTRVMLSLSAQSEHAEGTRIGLVGLLTRRVGYGLWAVRFPGLKDGLTDWKTSTVLHTGKDGRTDLIYAERKLAQGASPPRWPVAARRASVGARREALRSAEARGRDAPRCRRAANAGGDGEAEQAARVVQGVQEAAVPPGGLGPDGQDPAVAVPVRAPGGRPHEPRLAPADGGAGSARPGVGAVALRRRRGPVGVVAQPRTR
jgi:hypothetical protein